MGEGMGKPGIIDNPQKIGIGAVQSFGFYQMMEDMRLFEPAWYYTWESALPPVSANHWSTGRDIRMSGPEFDRHLLLGGSSDAWISQSVSVKPFEKYDFSFSVEENQKASGGAMVRFLDEAGKLLGSKWIALDDKSTQIRINDLVAPDKATEAKLLIWNNSGWFGVDDVSFSTKGHNLILNGSFQPNPSAGFTAWSSGQDMAVGGTGLDRNVMLNGSPDGWIYQDVSISSGATYALSLTSEGEQAGTGGVQVRFMDKAGQVLSKQWMAFDDASGTIRLDHLKAPALATQARVLVWGEAGFIEVDDVSLSLKSPNMTLNGGFETMARGKLDKWIVGKDIQLDGTSGDQHVVLKSSKDSWVYQDISVKAGEIYTMSLSAEGGDGAAGGVMARFLGADGKTVSEKWMPLSDKSGAVLLENIVVPVGAIKARLLAWGESGTLAVDDIAFSRQNPNLLNNGSFESIVKTVDADFRDGFVPMVWGPANAIARELEALKGEAVILGFNEPDERNQSAMSVEKAISLWPELMATGARLGSPATTTAGTLGEKSWLGQFMKQADAADLRVDFIAVHYYTTNKDVRAFEDFLNKVHMEYDRPIWVTEWALADWGRQNRFTLEENAKFFTDAVQMMDDLDFVERHAWFGIYDGMDGWNINTNLVDGHGTLTPVGKAFADLAGQGSGQSLAGYDITDNGLVDSFIF